MCLWGKVGTVCITAAHKVVLYIQQSTQRSWKQRAWFRRNMLCLKEDLVCWQGGKMTLPD